MGEMMDNILGRDLADYDAATEQNRQVAKLVNPNDEKGEQGLFKSLQGQLFWEAKSRRRSIRRAARKTGKLPRIERSKG